MIGLAYVFKNKMHVRLFCGTTFIFMCKMASGKAAGPSGIVAEMLKPVGEAGAVEVRDLIEDIISEGCIPTDWQESFIVNLYKGKGDSLNRGNYRGLKLIEQVM